MKKYIYTLSIIIIFILNIGPVNGQSENFELKLKIYEKEVSKDSHSHTYDIHITGRDVKFTGKHTGFKNEKEEVATRCPPKLGKRLFCAQVN